MDLETLVTLHGYNRWANERMFGAAAAVPFQDLVRDLGDGQGALRDTLTHIVWSEWIWLQRWTGACVLVFQPADFAHVPAGLVLAPADFPSVSALRERAHHVADETLAFLEGLQPETLLEPTTYQTVTGESWSRPLWAQLFHAVNHSSYHRGQVAALLRRLGQVPAATDFAGYEE